LSFAGKDNFEHAVDPKNKDKHDLLISGIAEDRKDEIYSGR